MNEELKRPIETIYKQSKGHCFGDQENINGTLILSNLRIYLQVDEETKVNEILLSTVKSVSIGGLNVLRFDLKDGQRHNFLVNNVISWYFAVKKALKNNN